MTVPEVYRAHDSAVPEFIYRYFDTEEHAQRLIEGHVRLSTFEHVRNMDNARADHGEGSIGYEPPLAVWRDVSNKNAAAHEMERLGIRIGPGSTNIAFVNSRVMTKLPDALIYCTSTLKGVEHMRRRFGKFCVQISDPVRFYREVTEQLDQHIPIAECAMGYAVYSDRRFVHEVNLPSPAFACPKGNEDEAEVRLIWRPRGTARLEPFELPVPGVRTLCSIV